METKFVKTTNEIITISIIGELKDTDIPLENIKTIEIGTLITSLGNSCFSGMQYLSKVIISENVTSIGESCFSNTLITSLRIPSSVNTIGNNCFNNCPKLNSIVFNDIQNITNIGLHLFNENIERTIILYNASRDNTAINQVPTLLKTQLDVLTNAIINYIPEEYIPILIPVNTVILGNTILKLASTK